MKRLFPRLALGLALLFGLPAAAADFTLAPQPKAVPGLAFADHDGHPLTLQSFKGKVVILDYWATWCAPCKAEFPQLDRLQGRLADKGLAVVAVSLDRGGMRAIDRFYDELHVANMGKFLDADGSGARALGIAGMPTTLLIDRQGREVARIEGTAPWDRPEMTAILERLLAGG